jgi:GNAT superfamily N-acetyltransferase
MIYAATREDLPKIIKMALNIPEEHGFENLPSVDIIKVTEVFHGNWLKSPIFVYKEDDKILGFVGTIVDSFWWSTEPVLADFVFYVDPKHRSLKVTNALIEAMKDFAKLNKMPVVTHFMSNERTETKEKMFERKGFKKIGFTASYGI